MECTDYRAANNRAQVAASDPFRHFHWGRKPTDGHDPGTSLPREGLGALVPPASGSGGSTGDQSMGIHTNGIDTIRMEASTMDRDQQLSAEGDWPGTTIKEYGGCSLQCRRREFTRR